MNDEMTQPDGEFAAMQTVYAALGPLDEGARRRVVDYVSSRLGILAPSARGHENGKQGGVDDGSHDEGESRSSGRSEATPAALEHFAEVFDAVGPTTEKEKALVAAYWLQTSTAASSVDGFSINKELRHLGHGVGNVTRAIDALKAAKPALMIQLKKSGKSRQARKEYKVTAAGVKFIEGLMNGEG